ncbi:MAG: hypothetical protein AAF530_01540 [Pseudomonadota bacterium]
MTGPEYIAALKKALRGLDRKTRDDVVLEIEGHIAALSEDNLSLIDRFGTPEALAGQYVEQQSGVDRQTKSLGQRVAGLGKGVLILIGSVTVLLVAGITLIVYSFDGDDFDYANQAAPELSATAEGWESRPWTGPVEINAQQAQIVLYWHGQDSLRWHCDGRQFNVGGRSMEVRHAHCLVFLPHSAASIQAEQSAVTIVRPQADVDIDLDQSRLRLAAGSQAYRFDIESDLSDVADFPNDPSAPLAVTIIARESLVEPYAYE